MKLKLNPEIFPEDKRNENWFQAGTLNYPSLFLNFDLEIIEEGNDNNHGEMLKLKVLNTKHKGVIFWGVKKDFIQIKE